MKDALPRFEKVLEHPLKLRKAAIPYIDETSVIQYLDLLGMGDEF